MNSRMLLASLAAAAIFSVASLSALPADRRRELIERMRPAAASGAGRALRFFKARRTRTVVGWGLALFAPGLVACFTLSLWWLRWRLPMPAVLVGLIDVVSAHHLLLCPVVAGFGAVLIPGTIWLRVSVGVCAGVAALFTYDIALRTLDVLFGMNITPA